MAAQCSQRVDKDLKLHLCVYGDRKTLGSITDLCPDCPGIPVHLVLIKYIDTVVKNRQQCTCIVLETSSALNWRGHCPKSVERRKKVCVQYVGVIFNSALVNILMRWCPFQSQSCIQHSTERRTNLTCNRQNQLNPRVFFQQCSSKQSVKSVEAVGSKLTHNPRNKLPKLTRLLKVLLLELPSSHTLWH